jgi:hypothetical protein
LPPDAARCPHDRLAPPHAGDAVLHCDAGCLQQQRRVAVNDAQPITYSHADTHADTHADADADAGVGARLVQLWA